MHVPAQLLVGPPPTGRGMPDARRGPWAFNGIRDLRCGTGEEALLESPTDRHSYTAVVEFFPRRSFPPVFCAPTSRRGVLAAWYTRCSPPCGPRAHTGDPRV